MRRVPSVPSAVGLDQDRPAWSEYDPPSPSADLPSFLRPSLRLLPIELAPPHVRSEFVLYAYRPTCTSWRPAVLTLFRLHNETLNIWRQATEPNLSRSPNAKPQPQNRDRDPSQPPAGRGVGVRDAARDALDDGDRRGPAPRHRGLPALGALLHGGLRSLPLALTLTLTLALTLTPTLTLNPTLTLTLAVGGLLSVPPARRHPLATHVQGAVPAGHQRHLSRHRWVVLPRLGVGLGLGLVLGWYRLGSGLG